MARSCLRVTRIWAEDLKDVNFLRIFHKMKPYVIVSLSGSDRFHEQKQCSPVNRKGGTSPSWNHTFSFTVDEAAARAGSLTLKFKIMAEKTLLSDREVGIVEVLVRELLEQQGGDGEPNVATYGVDVWLPSGEKTKGFLRFSYKFGELAMYPAAGAAPAEHPPPQMHGAPSHPPPQGYEHPPNAAPGCGCRPQGYVPPAPHTQPWGSVLPPPGYPPQGYASHPQGHGPPLGGYVNPAVVQGISAGGNIGEMLTGAMDQAGASGGFDMF